MSKHKTPKQRKEEKIKDLKAKLAKEKASYVRITMQLEITKQLKAALDEQHSIIIRQTSLAEQGKGDCPEYIELEQRNNFLEEFISGHKAVIDNLKEK